MTLPSRRAWKFLTKEEFEATPNIEPPGVETDMDRRGIHRIHGEGVVRNQKGEEISVDIVGRWYAKLLTEAVPEEWCYAVVSLTVLRAGQPVAVLPGTPVAFLPEHAIPLETSS